jgi:hypothetical protein
MAMGRQKIEPETDREIGLLRVPSQRGAIEVEIMHQADHPREHRTDQHRTDNRRQHPTGSRRRHQTDHITHHPPDSHQAIPEVVPWVEAMVADREEEALVAEAAGEDVSDFRFLK